jgi:hypothetical protein
MKKIERRRNKVLIAPSRPCPYITGRLSTMLHLLNVPPPKDSTTGWGPKPLHGLFGETFKIQTTQEFNHLYLNNY